MMDTDGDGLDDLAESGLVHVLPEFEWHDLSGRLKAYGHAQPNVFMGYSGVSQTLDFPSGVALHGVPCSKGVRFDNGLLSICAPGEGAFWVFPEEERAPARPRHLETPSVRCGRAGARPSQRQSLPSLNSRVNQLEDKVDRRMAMQDGRIAALEKQVDYIVRVPGKADHACSVRQVA